jgi:hypothetical protein
MVEIFYIEFKQDLCNDLWDIRNSSFMVLCKLDLIADLWVAESLNRPTSYGESLPCLISVNSITIFMEFTRPFSPLEPYANQDSLRINIVQNQFPANVMFKSPISFFFNKFCEVLRITGFLDFVRRPVF